MNPWIDILSCICDISNDFFFKIVFTGCTAWLGKLFTYNITQLSFFIKFVHKICHGNTALSQMSLFLMTNWSHFFSFCDIFYNGKIDESSFNTLVFFALQVRHVDVSPIVMPKKRRKIIRYGIIILFIFHIKSVISEGFFR